MASPRGRRQPPDFVVVVSRRGSAAVAYPGSRPGLLHDLLSLLSSLGVEVSLQDPARYEHGGDIVGDAVRAARRVLGID